MELSSPLSKDEELQVLALRDREQCRMIRRLPLLLEELQVGVRLRRRFADRADELFGGDARRAGGGGENAAGRERLERRAVQRRVAVEGGRHRLLGLRESGWIEHDQIEGLLFAAQELEDVAGDDAVGGRIDPVPLGVATGKFAVARVPSALYSSVS